MKRVIDIAVFKGRETEPRGCEPGAKGSWYLNEHTPALCVSSCQPWKMHLPTVFFFFLKMGEEVKAQTNQISGPRSRSSQVKINYGFGPGVTCKASGSSIVSLNRVFWEQRHGKNSAILVPLLSQHPASVLGSFTCRHYKQET